LNLRNNLLSSLAIETEINEALHTLLLEGNPWNQQFSELLEIGIDELIKFFMTKRTKNTTKKETIRQKSTKFGSIIKDNSEDVPTRNDSELFIWLAIHNLEKYFDLFQKNGYETLNDLYILNSQTFQELGIIEQSDIISLTRELDFAHKLLVCFSFRFFLSFLFFLFFLFFKKITFSIF